uniref:LRRNT domain-containing protein n=1 Tax=Glossina brevipalpis TaxID=37001 RepID=A0A1A9WU39_9MUSC
MHDSINQHLTKQQRQPENKQSNYLAQYYEDDSKVGSHSNGNIKSNKIIASIFQILKGMAGFRRRAGRHRTRSWFLLKDSVIFVIIMCALQVFFDNLTFSVSVTTHAQLMTNTTTGIVVMAADATETTNKTKELQNFTVDNKHDRYLSKAIKGNNLKDFNTYENLQQKQQQQTTKIIYVNKTTINDDKENSFNSSKHKFNVNNNSNDSRDGLVNNAVAAIGLSNITHKLLGVGLSSNHMGIRENVVLPSEDPEREARILYEKSLKEFHGNNLDNVESSDTTHILVATNDTIHETAQRTVHVVCDVWSQKHCHCTGTLGRFSLSCRNIGILAIPMDLPSDTVTLDLSNNNITALEANSFFMVTQLEELTLADNSLHHIDPLTFYGLNKLKRLNLQNCGLKSLTAHAFQGLTNLISFLLKRNQIMKITSGAFKNLTALKVLELDDNLINTFPEGLNKLTHLQEL